MEKSTAEAIQTISFSPDWSSINIGTSEGFVIRSINIEGEDVNQSIRGKRNSIYFLPISVEKNSKRCEYFNIFKIANIGNLVAYVRGGPCQELYIYDDIHDRESSKIWFKQKIVDFKLSENW